MSPKAGSQDAVIGMLYLVDVRMIEKGSDDITKQRLLVIGCQQADIESKLRWLYDFSTYSEFSITAVEKIREKVHVLSTYVTQAATPSAVIERNEGTVPVPSMHRTLEQFKPRLFAVGVTTTMVASDERHALRKVGAALSAHASPIKSHNGAKLSENSTLTVEELSFSTGYARPRDVSNESNSAHFVRG